VAVVLGLAAQLLLVVVGVLVAIVVQLQENLLEVEQVPKRL
jgi:hypothetical protein